jgi:hypothetical protein
MHFLPVIAPYQILVPSLNLLVKRRKSWVHSVCDFPMEFSRALNIQSNYLQERRTDICKWDRNSTNVDRQTYKTMLFQENTMNSKAFTNSMPCAEIKIPEAQFSYSYVNKLHH